VPAHTFVATCSAVVNVGATPVLVDVGKDFNIDVDEIEEVITDKTKGIIPVHLSGYMADMPRIMDIAQKYNVPVNIIIEQLGIPKSSALNVQKLGRLRKMYGFKMTDIEKIIYEYRKSH